MGDNPVPGAPQRKVHKLTKRVNVSPNANTPQGTDSFSPVTAQIREACLRLYETRGVDATTADDIAAASGISRRSLFRYFPSKDHVLFSDHDQIAALISRSLSAAGPSGDPQRVAVGAVASALRAYTDNPSFAFRRDVLVRANPSLAAREALWFRQHQETIAEYLVASSNSPVADLLEPVMAAALVAAMQQVIRRWIDDPFLKDPTSLYLEVAEDILNSMGVRATPPSQ